MALGWDAFESLLEGAAAMDRHFRLAEFQKNAPVMAAFADQLYFRLMQCQTRAIFAYDARLRLLPSYLQPLDMESHGKSATKDEKQVDGPTASKHWGGDGTDAQPEVVQSLHRGQNG